MASCLVNTLEGSLRSSPASLIGTWPYRSFKLNTNHASKNWACASSEAEGSKESQVLEAQGQAESKIISAEGEAQARLKVAQAEAKALEMIQNLADMIATVNGEDNPEHIIEWLLNIKAGWVNQIANFTRETSNWGIEYSRTVECKDCKKNFDISVPTNPITFFT